jgi:hypothetical protein
VTWYGPTCLRCKIDILDGTLCDFCEAADLKALAEGEARMLEGPTQDDFDCEDIPIEEADY